MYTPCDYIRPTRAKLLAASEEGPTSFLWYIRTAKPKHTAGTCDNDDWLLIVARTSKTSGDQSLISTITFSHEKVFSASTHESCLTLKTEGVPFYSKHKFWHCLSMSQRNCSLIASLTVLLLMTVSAMVVAFPSFKEAMIFLASAQSIFSSFLALAFR